MPKKRACTPISMPDEQHSSWDATDDELPSCRICFDNSSSVSPLISPCACKGSQKLVHIHCLRRWQSCVLEGKLFGGEPSPEKAHRCGVCLTQYTLAPLRSASFTSVYKMLLCVLLLTFLACTGAAQAVTASGWHHILLICLLLILGARSQPAVVLLMVLVLGTVGALYTRGLRLVLQAPSPTGALWGLALIRSGRPVEGVSPGMLLVASRDLSHTMFQESVILLLNYSAVRGAEGVMLTQPISHSGDVPTSWSHLLLGRRSTVPTSKAPSARQKPSSRRLEDTAAGSAGPSPEQLWEDVVRRFESRLVLQQHFGGPVGLSLHGLGESSGDEPHIRDYGGSAWSRAGHTPRDVTVLHDVPGLPNTKLALRPPHTREPGAMRSHAPDAACAVPAAQQPSRSSWKRARFTSASAQEQGDQQASSDSSTGQTQPSNCGNADEQGQRPAVEAGSFWVGTSPSEVLYQATQLLLPPRSSSGAAGVDQPHNVTQGQGLHRAEHSKSSTPATNSTGARPRYRVLVFYGKSGWAPGQLDGELRSGAWGLTPATQDDMERAVADPHSLWSHLMGSNRVTWL